MTPFLQNTYIVSKFVFYKIKYKDHLNLYLHKEQIFFKILHFYCKKMFNNFIQYIQGKISLS